MTRADVEPSTDHELLDTFRLTRSVAIQWVIVSTVGFFLCTYVFGLAYGLIAGESLEPITVTVSSPVDAFVGVLVLLVLVLAVAIPHELLHGVFMARYGARPTYGVGVSYFVLPYAYARSDGTSYTRNQMVVVLLAPLVGITGVGLVLMALVPSPLWIVPLAANAAGSIGDCWMAAHVLRYPSNVSVAELPASDESEGVSDGRDDAGFAIYGRRPGSDRSPQTNQMTASVSAFLTGAVTTLVALTVGLFALLTGSLAFGSGNVLLGNPESFWFLFRHEVDPDGPGALVEVGAPLLLALAVGGGFLATVGSLLLQRPTRE